MGILHDIKGYWDMSGSWSLKDYNMWEGKILLEDDGWFEGIVQDPFSPYAGDRMVFGIYHPTKGIELFKLSPSDVSIPLAFRGKRDAKGYDGEFSQIGYLGEEPIGLSHIITQNVEYLVKSGDLIEKDRDVVAEKADIEKRLEAFKEINNFKDLYENTLAIRPQLSEIISRYYRGVGFSEEEQETLYKEMKPIYDKVANAMMEDVKRLAKTLSNGESEE